MKTLTAAGIASALDAQRGVDHGIPLKLIFSAANIPVVQLSLHNLMNPVQHLVAGRALEALRDQDVLIIGTGMSFHNMRADANPQFGPASGAFDDWLTKAVEPNPQALSLTFELGIGARCPSSPPGPRRRTSDTTNDCCWSRWQGRGSQGVVRPRAGSHALNVHLW